MTQIYRIEEDQPNPSTSPFSASRRSSSYYCAGIAAAQSNGLDANETLAATTLRDHALPDLLRLHAVETFDAFYHGSWSFRTSHDTPYAGFMLLD